MRKNYKNVATISMFIAGVVESRLKADGYDLSSLFSKTNISHATWARLRKGQSKIDVEQLYNIQNAFGYSMSDIINTAEKVRKKAETENIRVIPPIPTNQGKLTKSDGLTLVSIAVLTFMALSVIRKS